jgi:hypothetical protein
MRLRWWYALGLIGLSFLSPRAGFADDGSVGGADQAAIRQVIQNQIAAFRRDDGAAAFSYASPSIRAQFGSPENFMHIVRNAYQPVYRPSSVRRRSGRCALFHGATARRVMAHQWLRADQERPEDDVTAPRQQ